MKYNIDKFLDFAESKNVVSFVEDTGEDISGSLYLPGTTVFRDENRIGHVTICDFYGELVYFEDGDFSLNLEDNEDNLNQALDKLKGILENKRPNNTPLTFREEYPNAMFNVDGLPLNQNMIDAVNMLAQKFDLFFDVTDCLEDWAVIELKDGCHEVAIEVDVDTIIFNDNEISIVDLVHKLSFIFEKSSIPENRDTVKLGGVSGRHEIPNIDGYVLDKVEDPSDLISIEHEVYNRLDKLDLSNGLDLYVTGLTSVTLSVVKYCLLNNIELTCYHFDIASKQYLPQKIM